MAREGLVRSKFYIKQKHNKMSSCHQSCLTCSVNSFSSCLSCASGLTLSASTCSCDTPWQQECTGQYSVREAVQFADIFIKLYIVGVMLLYVLRTRLPLSYRCWSGLCGLSLLLYSPVLYLQYEDELCLRALAVSNGPYFATYRIMSMSTSHIFPTMSIFIIICVLLVLLYFPFTVYGKPRQSVLEYVKNEGLHLLDCAYFFASKMIFFYLGKFILQSSTASVTYIVVVGVYGLFVLLVWARNIYKYHQGTVASFAYDSPIFLYTMLAPAAMIGLPMASSEIILVVIYCAPLALLFLIMLLNRNMKVFTKSNVKFFVVEAIMIGVTVGFILLNDEIKTYLMLAIIFGSAAGISGEVWVAYNSGFDLGDNKVHPELSNLDDQPVKKRIYGQEKDGYF